MLHAGSAPVGLVPRSQHKRTSRPGDPGMSPAQVYRGYMTGPSPVHGRHIDRLCRIQSLTGDIGNSCGTTPPLSQRGCVGRPSQRQRRALGQRLNRSLDGMVRADPAARPDRRHEQGQPAQREQDGEERNRPAGMSGTSSDEQSRPPDNGTKQAQIGKASGYTHRSFRPDAVRYMSVTTAMHRPTVTHPDTWRDKKETARRAAFPQPGGRFRWWWQVLGSNQRRLSRRLYQPLRPDSRLDLPFQDACSVSPPPSSLGSDSASRMPRASAMRWLAASACPSMQCA